jgi:hypothetical protein
VRTGTSSKAAGLVVATEAPPFLCKIPLQQQNAKTSQKCVSGRRQVSKDKVEENVEREQEVKWYASVLNEIWRMRII